MKPGRPKTPSALNDLRGNPGKRARNTEEPRPAPASSLEAPGWLDREARDVWNELAPELARINLLSVIDVSVLAGGCRWWAIYRKADRALRRGLVATTKANGSQPVPHLKIAATAFDKAMDIFARFGITPSERAKLQVPQPKGVGENAGSSGSDDATPKPLEPHDELARRRRERATAGPVS